MSNLINRMRLQAEDLHVINPTCETVKCLSLGADRITQLEALIREVAIPALNIGRSCFPTIREAEDKLREAIK